MAVSSFSGAAALPAGVTAVTGRVAAPLNGNPGAQSREFYQAGSDCCSVLLGGWFIRCLGEFVKRSPLFTPHFRGARYVRSVGGAAAACKTGR